MSHFLLQLNLGALLTSACRLSRLCKICYPSNHFLLILGVAVRSGRLFSITKADWGLEKLLVIQSREVVAPERLLYIEVIVISIWT